MAGNERHPSIRFWRHLGVLAFGVFALMAFACGPLEDEGQPTEAPEAAPARISEQPAALVEGARKAMAAQQGFRGGFAYLPSVQEARFTYGSPNTMLVEDMGGDFEKYMLLIGDEVFFSSDGRRWRTSPDGSAGFLGFFRTNYDPRVALRYGIQPEAAGEEEIQGRRHHVVRLALDAKRLVADLGEPEPSVRVSLNFPFPEGAEARNLERLGYEVIGAHDQDSSSWDLFKDRYHVTISEQSRRPGAPRIEWGVWVFATIRGASSLDPGVELELRELLEAYGAEPDLVTQARLTPTSQESPEDLMSMFEQATAKLWIDAETHLVRRLEWQGPQRGPEWVISFWDYGQVAGPQRPQLVMDAARAEALGSVANAAFDDFRSAIEAYKSEHGQYPEAASQEVLGSKMRGPWPVNPFTGGPVRNAPDSPGDIHYVRSSDTYRLSVYGWDQVIASRFDSPPPVQTVVIPGPPAETAATPGPPPQAGMPPATVQVQTAITAAAPTPVPTPDLGPARAQRFVTLWFGRERAMASPEGTAMPALGLLEIQVCPQERACVWPVLLSYTIEGEEKRFGIPALRISTRPRSDGDSPRGESRAVAGLDATVQVERVDLPYGSGQAWEATIWLSGSVVKISAVPFRKGDSDHNPYNSESGMRLLIDSMEFLSTRASERSIPLDESMKAPYAGTRMDFTAKTGRIVFHENSGQRPGCSAAPADVFRVRDPFVRHADLARCRSLVVAEPRQILDHQESLRGSRLTMKQG